ncbi:MAG TPA: hypothetical protein H9799_07915 [Candidatus Mediterraneibacter merdipullorum]|nr:hypothetical protein [Candidatus Mediterraneibacter merdipullorum]
MKKAQITAFLSMVFVLLVSFVLGMLEITVIHTAGNVSRLAVDRALFSIFGEYQKELFDDYQVFAIDGSYGTRDFREERLTDRMRYYGTAGIDQEIKGIQYLTDENGQAFREQVLEFMEVKYGADLVREFTGLTSRWEEESIQGSEMEEKEQGMFDEIDRLREAAENAEQSKDTEDTEESGDTQGAGETQDTETAEGNGGTEDAEAQMPEGNPFSCLEQIEKNGILSIVLPEDMELSGRRIEPETQATGRDLQSGRGTFPHRQGMDGIEEKLLFNEYLLMNFTDATGGADASDGTAASGAAGSGQGGSAVSDIRGERSLAYEIEYILEGRPSDKENLEAVLMKLFLIRMALNYVYLLGDSAKQAEAMALAVTVTTILLIPEGAEAAKQLILLAWAAGEGVLDLRTLLAGKRTALMKSAENWQLSLSGLLTLGSSQGQTEGQDVPGGITYREYLRAFLFLGDTEEITMRTLDRIEENLALTYGLQYFRADRCVTRMETENTAVLFGEVTYTFPAYFGYD